MYFEPYDIIVVGAGHAGCEAAAAAANMGSKVLLITMDLRLMASMSCNPAMGGIAKGQIVREIDAMGGYSGIVSDRTMIQFRMLNKSKGPAMWSPRCQSDKMMFSAEWRSMLEKTPNVDFWQDTVIGLLFDGDQVKGVKTMMGGEIESKAVILTNGTFLNGLIHIGEQHFSGGRMGEVASHGISEQLKEIGFEVKRLKTGTPVRIDGRTIDFSKLVEQKGDDEVVGFSYTEPFKISKQRSCWIAHTSLKVHETLRKGFKYSPMFNGRIQGVGPRYCPSIGIKLSVFLEKTATSSLLNLRGGIPKNTILTALVPHCRIISNMRHCGRLWALKMPKSFVLGMPLSTTIFRRNSCIILWKQDEFMASISLDKSTEPRVMKKRHVKD